MYQRVQHLYFKPWELTNYEHLSNRIRDLFERQNVSFITFGVNWQDYQTYPYAGSSGYFLRGDDSAIAYGQLRGYTDLKYTRAIHWIDVITPDRCSGWQSI